MSTSPDNSAASTVDDATLDDGFRDTEGLWSIALTLLVHPDARRVGERALLFALEDQVEEEISRVSPKFYAPGAAEGRAMEHLRISRRPLRILRTACGVVLAPDVPGVRLDGRALTEPIELGLARLDAGALLEVGETALLWLHRAPKTPEPLCWHGIWGLCGAIHQLRAQIAAVAPGEEAVLILGESGVGKELVARAIHALSPRATRPLVAVNVAAIPTSMAAAELFGHGKGAFTGALRDREGWFEQAEGGTLFLDEVGDLAREVQPILLRVLESGEIQPVGRAPRAVSVRILSASDANFSAMLGAKHFRPALFHRLARVVIRVPPLRERTVDIPLLFQHFVRQNLAARGLAHRLEDGDPGARPWLGLRTVLRVMSHPFPGNVRELSSLAAQVVLRSMEEKKAILPEGFVGTEDTPSPGLGAPLPPDPGVALRAALERNAWNVSRVARELGIARNTVLARIRRDPELCLAKDLDEVSLRAALHAAHGSVDGAALRLGVSTHALKLRLTALGSG